MKRYSNLFEKIVNFKNLCIAAHKALRGKKSKKSAAQFYFDLEKELLDLEKELLSDIYRPRPYNTFTIHDPKTRKISAANFRDRVVHHAICNIIEPIFEKSMIFDTYACRKEKGTHAAVKRVQHFSRCFPYFIKCDIEKYFENIDHAYLKKIIRKKIKDKQLLNLLDIIIDYPIDNDNLGKGLPIGNLTSQLFANIYLSELDHFIKDKLGRKGFVRYMDDFITFGYSRTDLNQLLKQISCFVTEQLLLKLKDRALILSPTYCGISFLGFRIYQKTIRLSRKNVIKFRRKITKKEQEYLNDDIEQDSFINSVNSMISHISHANTYKLRKKVFDNLII